MLVIPQSGSRTVTKPKPAPHAPPPPPPSGGGGARRAATQPTPAPTGGAAPPRGLVDESSNTIPGRSPSPPPLPPPPTTPSPRPAPTPAGASPSTPVPPSPTSSPLQPIPTSSDRTTGRGQVDESTNTLPRSRGESSPPPPPPSPSPRPAANPTSALTSGGTSAGPSTSTSASAHFALEQKAPTHTKTGSHTSTFFVDLGGVELDGLAESSASLNWFGGTQAPKVALSREGLSITDGSIAISDGHISTTLLQDLASHYAKSKTIKRTYDVTITEGGVHIRVSVDAQASAVVEPFSGRVKVALSASLTAPISSTGNKFSADYDVVLTLYRIGGSSSQPRDPTAYAYAIAILMALASTPWTGLIVATG